MMEPKETRNPKETQQARQALRQEMLRRREELPLEEWSKRSRQILERYIASPYFRRAEVVLAYQNTRNEPDLSMLFSRCFAEGRPIAVPRVLTGIREGAQMEFVFVRPDSRKKENVFHIPEPEEGEVFSWEEWEGKRIELILPGLCFDRQGGRLGYGGGYYDRYLALYGQRIHKTVLAFSFQTIEALPCQEQDIPYDVLITEEKFINNRQERK